MSRKIGKFALFCPTAPVLEPSFFFPNRSHFGRITLCVRSRREILQLLLALYFRNGLLHVLQIDDPSTDPQGLTEGVGKLVNKIFANTSPPYRIVSRWTRDIYSNGGKRANMEVEVTCHSGYLGELPQDNPYSMFGNFPRSMICHYPVDRFNINTHSDWIKNHLSTHQAAIYVPKSHDFKLIRLY